MGEAGSEGRQTRVEILLLLDVSLSVMNRSLLDVYTLKEELLDDLDENVSIGVYAFANKLTQAYAPDSRPSTRLQNGARQGVRSRGRRHAPLRSRHADVPRRIGLRRASQPLSARSLRRISHG